MACPPSVNRQSLDALPIRISWELPTVAGIPVDKGSCSSPSGNPFPIGTSTVSCTADQTTLAASCSFSITITPPDTRLQFTKFMAFGDSITAGFVGDSFLLPPGMTARDTPARLRAAGGRTGPGISSAVQPLTAYPAQLQILLAPGYPNQQITVANEGLSGELVREGVTRLTASLLSVQPEVLILFEGFNDIDLALLDRGSDDTPIDVRPIRDELFVMALNTRNQGIEVLLATLTPVTDVREDTVPGTRAAILELNSLIRGIAAQLGLSSVVDLHAGLDGIPGMIGADGFHPTVAGYRRMAEIFSAAIVSRYDATPRPPVLTALP
jgi:lysophospholipase L1-like esterase